MPFPVKRRYGLPAGYRALAAPTYKPWNGSLSSPSPARTLLGAVQNYTIGSVPADLSTFILNPPNGGAGIVFQFVYNASVWNAGIKIPLPLSGGSTAAQVRTAMATVMGLPATGALTFTGAFVAYPFRFIPNLTAQFEIDWTVAGPANLAGGTQVTITPGAVVQQAFSSAPVVPGRFGKNHAWLHGI